MSKEQFEYNNSAGRLYQNFKAISSFNNTQAQLVQVAAALGVDASWESVFLSVADMRRDYELLEEEINEIRRANESKFFLWNDKLGDIKKSVNAFSVNHASDYCSFNVSPIAIISLQFIAADLAQEHQASPDELEQIRSLCESLRAEILGAEELPRVLRNWLLDLVRVMRDGIDRYKIRGSRGLQRNLNEIVGAIVLHPNLQKQTETKAPAIWKRWVDCFEMATKVGQVIELGGKGLEYVMKAIGTSLM